MILAPTDNQSAQSLPSPGMSPALKQLALVPCHQPEELALNLPLLGPSHGGQPGAHGFTSLTCGAVIGVEATNDVIMSLCHHHISLVMTGPR